MLEYTTTSGRNCMRTCENCGKRFVGFRYQQRFCSRSCSDEWFKAEARQALERFRAEGCEVRTQREAAA